MSKALPHIIFFTLGILLLFLFWLFVIFKMKNHVSKIKEKYVDGNSIILRNSKVYFKNFDLSKSKQFFPSSPFEDPLYTFNLCDIYINLKSILIIGKMKSLGRINELNITVLNKNTTNSSKTILKDLRRTKTHLELEFKDSRFDKNIIAMIKIEKQYKIDEYLKNWI